jgi:hypothetical protein
MTQPSAYTSNELVLLIPHGWCSSLLGLQQQDTTGPHLAQRVDDLPSFPFLDDLSHSDGPTVCLTLTHRTRQRISRHSPSPTSRDALTSREETIRLSPFLSTRAPTDATTRPCLELQTYSEVVWPHCALRAPRDNWSPQQRRPFSCHICTRNTS